MKIETGTDPQIMSVYYKCVELFASRFVNSTILLKFFHR